MKLLALFALFCGFNLAKISYAAKGRGFGVIKQAIEGYKLCGDGVADINSIRYDFVVPVDSVVYPAATHGLKLGNVISRIRYVELEWGSARIYR